MISGAIKDISISPTRRDAILSFVSYGPGILGCIETQVHARRVARQLQIIFHIVLHRWMSLQDTVSWTNWISDVTGVMLEMGDA